MDQFNEIINTFFFIILPYLSIFILLLVSIYRYRSRSFVYSSLSSQFLENRQHFWGMVPFHYGILTIFAGHLAWFFFPETTLLWNSVPLRLYIMEVSVFIFGLLTFTGLINIIIRRRSDKKTKVTTTVTDWIVLILLTIQIMTGLYVAFFYRWGSSWFASSMSPYLYSIFKFNPELAFISSMPFMVKLHIILAFSIILLFPFTRLVHVLVVPNPYLWRKPQVVRWNWDRKKIRDIENNSI